MAAARRSRRRRRREARSLDIVSSTSQAPAAHRRADARRNRGGPLASDPPRRAAEPDARPDRPQAPSPEPDDPHPPGSTDEPSGSGSLAAAWSALDASGTRWLLLRGDADGRDGDIDLLIHPADIGPAGAALARAGWSALRAIGHHGHRFYRTYDTTADRWLTIDAVTELAFGRGASRALDGAAAGVLERRDRMTRPARPAADDAFWTLLLHVLLDKGGTDAARAAILRGLVAAARIDGPLASRIDALGGRGTADRLVGLVTGSDLAGAAAAGRNLARRWGRATAGTTLHRLARHAILSRLRKPHTALRRRGIDVTVLGPDGAGKSTVAAALSSSLPFPTRTIYLGLYAAGLDGVRHFGLARRLARVWRGWLAGAWHRLRGRLVVYDRHALDARLGRSPRGPKARIRRWLLTHALPEPDLVLILDAPAELLFARKGEHDVATLDAQRRGYLALAAALRHAEIVDATRPADDVRRDATARVWRRMGEGGRGG